ncbi:MAG: TonB-dependent receptor [Pseudomonadales bacterium]|nr:TonB-dependent receptor [Pseudomonadales bacterium]MBO6565325.1 TonB-dependent receptor [Pseudomonadales bacterium]MBO6597897.1 TonB-dependent receptor [Pseudomonadales bacterium]MBO6657651.1 TonB-dependent receptor [Pseudomonadales bacterium]MBO6702282.1 TonB-dependent receptor [Pseudomonadales bacterium]
MRKLLFAAFVLAGFYTSGVYAEELVIEEVIVTAQKREQSVQEVPIAVSAFDGEFLDEAGVDDVLELQFFVPGMTIYNNQTPAQTNINIRGVGTAGNSLSLESSVGLYIDGVYRSRQTSSIGDLVDVERVEVLKGPQGTLFGKNTASGAIQFLTRKPELDTFGGFLELQAGNQSYGNVKGAVNIPLSEGVSALRISGSATQRDGYVDNITTGSELNDRDRYNVRAQFLATNQDDITIRIIADYSEITEICCAAGNIFDGPGDNLANFLAAGGSLPPTGNLPGASFVLPLDVIAGLTGFTGTPVILADQFDDDIVAQSLDPYANVEESGISMEITWDVNDNMTFTSITSYRNYEVEGFVDADFNSLDMISRSGGFTDQDTFTQEFRIDGVWGDMTYVAGMYYFDQELENHNTLKLGNAANVALTGGLPTFALLGVDPALCPFIQPVLGITEEVCLGPAFPPGLGSDNFSTQEQTSWAIYGQADWNLSEDVVLTLGLRYLDEEKTMDVQFAEDIFTPIYGAFTPLSPFVPDVDNETFEDDEFTGTLKLTYFWNDEIMTYASYGRGYKSGGTNIDRISPATGAPLLFDPETSESYEIGMKGDFLQNQLRLNMALYRTDFDDFQANTFVGTGFVLQNAGEIATNGFELDFMYLLNAYLTVTGGAAYVDAEYDSFTGGSCIRTPFGNEPDANEPAFPTVCDASGNLVGGTSEWTYYASLIGEYDLDNGLLYGRIDVNYRDDIPSGTDNDPNKGADGYTLANVRVGYLFGGDKYDLSLWAKNAFDEDYRDGGFNSVLREGSLSGYYTEPRTYGLTFRVNFDQ